MYHYNLLILFALLILAFGLFSRLSERYSITGPMVFLSAGLLASPLALGPMPASVDPETITLIAELALTLVLFIDASYIDVHALRTASPKIAPRLLLVGLPLTMLAGVALGLVMFDTADAWAVVLMALILSPTDAALGQAVVNDDAVPEPVRRAISVESGLNDGIVLPPILFCLAVLGAESEVHGGDWPAFLLAQLTLGPLVGLAVGFGGGKCIKAMSGRGWMEETFQRLSVVPLAILAYSCAELAGGNGFIAAFAGGIGLTLGESTRAVRLRMQQFGETEGTQLILVVFLIFGLAVVPRFAGNWGWLELGYAIASLTVLRMVPVAISLLGTGLGLATTGFIGWFGPRGVASVLYLLMALASLGDGGYEQVMSVIVLTVVISVYAHGITAVPLSRRYGRSVRSVGRDE